MARKTVEVDVDIDFDVFSTEEIIEELEYRIKRKYDAPKGQELYKLANLLSGGTPDGFSIETGFDRMKLEHFAKIFQKYTLAQIEAALPEF